MKTISIKGVLIGSIIDYVLGRAFFALPVLYVMLDIRRHNDTLTGMAEAAFAAVENSLALHYTQILGGLAGTVIAGYAAARIAKRGELLNGLLAAVPCSVLAGYRLLGVNGAPISAIDVVVIAAALACGGFGGALRSLQRRASMKSRQAASR